MPFPSQEPKASKVRSLAIVDPIDKAMHLLVHELGFAETNAKRALAMCDSGSGIDVQKAIELLSIESKGISQANTPIELPTPADIVSPLRPKPKRKEFCEGSASCKRTTTLSIKTTGTQRHSRAGSVTKHHRTTSLQTQIDTEDLSPITDIYGDHSPSTSVSDHSILDTASEEWRREEARGDTISPLMSHVTSPYSVSRGISRMSTRSGHSDNSKAWKVLGVQEYQAPKVGRARPRRSTGVVGMEEYERRVERKRSMRLMQLQEKEMGELKKGRSALESPITAGEKSMVKDGLSQQLKGLGLGTLGGLGGFRVVEREVTVKLKEKKGIARGSMGGCMPVSPC